MALCTPADVRARLPGLTGTDQDAVLATLIDVVGAQIAQYLGYPAASGTAERTAESTTYTLYLDGPGGQDLWLPVFPVSSITSIYDSASRPHATTDLVAATDYELLHIDGMALVQLDTDSGHGAWSTGRRNIKATVVAGYATVPSWLELAAAEWAAWWWRARTEGKHSVVTQGGQSATMRANTMPDHVRELLDPHMLVPSRVA